MVDWGYIKSLDIVDQVHHRSGYTNIYLDDINEIILVDEIQLIEKQFDHGVEIRSSRDGYLYLRVETND